MALPPTASCSTSSPASDRQAEATAPAVRLEALDFAKGVLVFLMVVYHSLNYTTDYRLPFRYLSFLPPTFILVTGFLLSYLYLSRLRPLDAAQCRRMVGRGVKLLLLFALLNIASQFARSKNYHGPSSGLGSLFDAAPTIFGAGGSHLVAFDVLLPIAYLLILAPGLLWLMRVSRFGLPSLAVVVLLTCTLLEKADLQSPNLEFFAAGVVGMLLGQIPASMLKRGVRIIPVVILAYGIHLLIAQHLGQPFLHQLVAALLALAMFFGLGLLSSNSHWSTRRLQVLGQYSLVGYIGQIALLQLYSHLIGRPDPSSPDLLLMFFVALGFTVGLSELTKWAKRRWNLFDQLYRAVLP